MRFFERLDLTLLDSIFQAIADWVNNNWSKSCFWLARSAGWSTVVASGLLVLHTRSAGAVLISVLVCFSILMIDRPLKQIDKAMQQPKTQGFLNPLRFTLKVERAAFIFLTIFALVMVIIWLYFKFDFFVYMVFLTIASFCSAVSMYFASCNIKPRKPKAVEEPALLNLSPAAA